MYEDKTNHQAPAILRFLIKKLKNNERIFTSLDMKMSDSRLVNSGDRILRKLAEYNMVKYEVQDQSKGVYKIQSDLFDLIIELNRIEESGEVYVMKPVKTFQLELI